MRQALNAIATVAPEWLRALPPAEWFDRYARRIEDARLPTKPEERQQYAELIGADGMYLLEAVYAADAPGVLRELEAVQILRQVWVHQFETIDGQLHWRDPKNSPPPASRLDTPYEPEARYGTKRTTSWVGYKVHLTETCDPEDPYLITQVQTTASTTSDISQVTPIHQALATKQSLPGQHLVDSGYVSADELVTSRVEFAWISWDPFRATAGGRRKSSTPTTSIVSKSIGKHTPPPALKARPASAGRQRALRTDKKRSVWRLGSAIAHLARLALCARGPRPPRAA
jgi:transposase